LKLQNSNKELFKLILTIVSFNYNLDIHGDNSAIPCELFGIPKCALFIVHLKHCSEDSLMMDDLYESKHVAVIASLNVVFE